MSPLSPLFVPIQVALATAAIALVARGRWRLCLFLVLYLAWFLGNNLLLFADTDRYYRQWFFMRLELGLDVLKLGTAFEVARRTFRLFPGAAMTTRKIWLAVLAVAAASALSVAAGVTDDNAFQMQQAICARVQCGILWLIATTLLVAHWYRVPVHPFHAVVLTSLGAYLSVFLILLTVNVYLPWAGLYTWIDDAAYIAAVGCWAYAAWRPESHGSRTHVALLRKLQLRPFGHGRAQVKAG